MDELAAAGALAISMHPCGCRVLPQVCAQQCKLVTGVGTAGCRYIAEVASCKQAQKSRSVTGDRGLSQAHKGFWGPGYQHALLGLQGLPMGTCMAVEANKVNQAGGVQVHNLRS